MLTKRQARLARVTANRILDARYIYGSELGIELVFMLGTVYGVPREPVARRKFIEKHVDDPVIRQELRKAGLRAVTEREILGVKALAGWGDLGDNLIAGKIR